MMSIEYLFVVIFGLIIGSFLNCLVWRLYTEESLWGRSYCPRCKHQIAWYDNIPVLSFLLLRGKCRHCHQSISWQYPIIEAITAILFVLFFHFSLLASGLSLLLIYDWFLITIFIVIFISDLRWQLVPMNFVWPMTVVMVIVNYLMGVSWWQILLGGAIGAGFFLIQYIITKRKGIGEGDIWLGLLLGVSFPAVHPLLVIFFVTYILGALVAVLLMSLKKSGLKSQIALGPFMMIGGLVALLYVNGAINLSFLGF